MREIQFWPQFECCPFTHSGDQDKLLKTDERATLAPAPRQTLHILSCYVKHPNGKTP